LQPAQSQSLREEICSIDRVSSCHLNSLNE
jgi:hypothetical protein